MRTSLWCLALTGLLAAGGSVAVGQRLDRSSLQADLTEIFADPIVSRALVGIHIESLESGEILFSSNATRHVVPASNMKIVTLAVAADVLGWDYVYETRLEATGDVRNGILDGDLVVTGSGDPSIGSADREASPVFSEWVVALRQAGITRVNGRLIGDDNVFDDEGRGAGWAWDYLTAGYAAPSGGLSYNENVAVVRAQPGTSVGDPGRVEITPAGHGLTVRTELTTGAPDSRTTVAVTHPSPGTVHVSGSLPVGGDAVVRTTSVDNPTSYFVEGLHAVLAGHGITVSEGAFDIDDVDRSPSADRRLIATHTSPPLSVLGGYLMKVSQNFYAESLLKTVGRVAGGEGSADAGRRVVAETLAGWGVPDDSIVMYDGSGLSRYNYVTAEAIVFILKRLWHSDRHRGPFVATLPVGGQDGSLANRMGDPALAGRVLAKTGTIANMRALSGFLITASGERIVFSIIANHFTAPSREVDALVERALARVSAGTGVSSY